MKRDFTAWMWILGATFLRLFQGILIAQLAGPVVMGVYLKVLLVPTLAAKIGDLSVSLSLSYHLRKGLISPRVALKRTLLHFFGLSVVAYALAKGAALWPGLDDSVRNAYSDIAILIGFVSAYEFLLGAAQAILVATNRSAHFALASIISLAFFCTTLYLAEQFRTTEGLIELRFLAFLIFLLGLTISVLTLRTEASIEQSVGWHQQYGFAMRAYPGNVFKNIAARMDRLILLTMISNADYAFYNLAITLRETIVSLSTSFGQFLLNRVVDHLKEGKDAYRIFVRTLLFFATISLCGVAALIIAAPYLIPFLYGPQFSHAVPYLRVVAWSVMFVTLSGLCWYYLVSVNRPGLLSWAVIAENSISLPVIYLLTRLFGAMGASWAVLISSLVSFTVAGNFAFRVSHSREQSS